MKNNLLTEKLVYNGDSATKTHAHLWTYSEQGLQEIEVQDISHLETSVKGGEKLWLRVHGFKDTGYIEAICRMFGVDFLTMQDILNVMHPSKIEEHDGYIFVVARVIVAGEILGIRIIQGNGFVISFSDREAPFYDDVVKALQNNTMKIRNRTSDYLFSVLVNGLASNYVSVAMDISDTLEDLETDLMDGSNNADTGAAIQFQRKRYMELKRIVFPMKDEYPRLLNSDSGLISEAVKPFMNDVNDHLLNAVQIVEGCRETLSSLMDLYISNNNTRMNDIMKKLTVVSTIFIPMTFLVGVWGMNFKIMPELNWDYGYLAAWGTLLLTGVVAYFIFKTKKWR